MARGQGSWGWEARVGYFRAAALRVPVRLLDCWDEILYGAFFAAMSLSTVLHASSRY